MTEWLNHPHQIKTISSILVLLVLLAWETFAPFLPFFQSRLDERVQHALRNFILGAINAAVTSLFIVLLWVAVTRWAAAHQFGVLNWLNLPALPHLLGALVLFDVWMYWWHRMNHRMPFLWRFHRTHHSDPKMDVTTAHRFHFGEIFSSSLLRAPVLVLLGMRLEELVIYEAAMFAVVQLHHANIGLPPKLDQWLRLLIVTPAMHKVHHSRLQPETDSNYSSLFSWCDRLFASFRLRDDPHAIEFGLKDFDRPEQQTLAGLVKTPLEQSVGRRTRKLK